MKCKKCKKDILEESVYCMWCGAAQKKDRKKKMYQRPDGLFEKIIVLNDKRVPFRGKTESEVYKKIAAYEEKQESGRTFAEVAEEWENVHFTDISLTSQKTYKPCIRRALDYFATKPMKLIAAQDIKLFLDSVARKGYAHKTIANQRIVLKQIFDHACFEDGLPGNPVDFVKMPRGLEKNERKLPSDADIKLIQCSTEKPCGLLAYFLLYTGCRRGEAIALQYKDIDRESKVIHITKSVFYYTNSPQIKEPKTKAGYRDIPLLDVLADKMPNGNPDSYVFSPDGNLYHSSRLTREWERYCELTGVACTPHQLRHAYATMLYEAGIDRKDAQGLMGHADIKTTDSIYTHISNAQWKRTAEKLNVFTKSTQ